MTDDKKLIDALEIHGLLGEFVELNLGNYSDDDVRDQQDWALSAHDALTKAAARLEALTAPQGEAANPLTAAQLADALSCFWNAAIGEAHEKQDGFATATIMASGFAAVEQRLREISALTHPTPDRGDLVKAVFALICDDVLPSYGIDSAVGRNDPELVDAIRITLDAALTKEGK